jgi:hypothetical protein
MSGFDRRRKATYWQSGTLVLPTAAKNAMLIGTHSTHVYSAPCYGGAGSAQHERFRG